ncbi:MAG: hypothetical protein J0L51_10070 [Rhizobiales bacterium]|nr:hypothetical protein [Hyphomicrobiales bacterium]
MKELDAVIAAIREQIDAAYQRGFAAGAEDMRGRILQLAQAEVRPRSALADMFAHQQPAQARRLGDIFGEMNAKRAPRGSVGRMINQILAEHPEGLIIAEVEGLAPQYDAEVAIKSIGNELRRFEGERYRRDERGKWFLASGNAEKETAGMP